MADQVPYQFKTYKQHKEAMHQARVDKQQLSGMGKVDAFVWSSSVFSRRAMALNYCVPHRYGDRMALGAFRSVTSFIMFTVFVFLTVYQSLETNDRPVYTMQWWVTFATLFFFAQSMTPYDAYFHAKAPNPRGALDGPHPFYDWKILTITYSLAFQGSIHLVFLTHMQSYDPEKTDLIITALAYVPLCLLVSDFFANRLYFPILIVIGYSCWAYSFALLAILIRTEVELAYSLPELTFFDVANMQLAWSLPICITVSFYLATRFKFWYLGDGDLTFDFNTWAKEAHQRMDFMEGDGAREEENFYFNVQKDDVFDYKNPKNAETVAAHRKEVNSFTSSRHKRLATQSRRQMNYMSKKTPKEQKYQDEWLSKT